MTLSDEVADASARLLRIGRPVGNGQRAAPNHADEIARGGLADLLEIVRADDGELWRYTLVLHDDRQVRNGDLRALMREPDDGRKMPQARDR